MSTPFADKVAFLEAGIDGCIQAFDSVWYETDLAYAYANQGYFRQGIQHCCEAVNTLMNALDLSFQHYYYPYDDYSIIQVLKLSWEYYHAEMPAAEVTWKSIVEAWGKDDFEGRFWTIAFIDRMRQIIWDEPFEITWAARPEQQEV